MKSEKLLFQKNLKDGWAKAIGQLVGSLHMAALGLILSSPFSPLSPSGAIPEFSQEKGLSTARCGPKPNETNPKRIV